MKILRNLFRIRGVHDRDFTGGLYCGVDALDGRLEFYSIKYSRMAQRNGKIVGPDKDSVDAIDSGDLFDLVQTFLCFALWEDQCFPVSHGEVVLQTVVGERLIPIAAVDPDRDTSHTHGIVLGVGHQIFYLFYCADLGDDQTMSAGFQNF